MADNTNSLDPIIVRVLNQANVRSDTPGGRILLALYTDTTGHYQDPASTYGQRLTDSYDDMFPHGWDMILTSAHNYECGLYAIVHSLASQHPRLPQPTVHHLRAIARRPALGIENVDNFADEELDKIVSAWGNLCNAHLCLGFVTGTLEIMWNGAGPVIVPERMPDYSDFQVVWIHNDGRASPATATEPEILSHWSGLNPRSASDFQTYPTDAVAIDATSQPAPGPVNEESQTEVTSESAAILAQPQSSQQPTDRASASPPQPAPPVPAVDPQQQAPVSPDEATKDASVSPRSSPVAAVKAPQVRRSARTVKATAKVEIHKQQQQKTTAKKSPPSHRYLCLIDSCKCSHNDLKSLNTHRRTKHNTGELAAGKIADHEANWLDWLARSKYSTRLRSKTLTFDRNQSLCAPCDVQQVEAPHS